MAYYKVIVKHEELFEVLVKAEGYDEAREKAKECWPSYDPIHSDADVYEIIELKENK